MADRHPWPDWGTAPRYEAVEETFQPWEVFRGSPNVPGKCCRYTVGPNRATCRRAAVARLKRGRVWWAYCAHHLFGRWVEDGKVMAWRGIWPEDEPRG